VTAAVQRFHKAVRSPACEWSAVAGVLSFEPMSAIFRPFLAMAFALGLAQTALAEPKAVVELFTSQGCSSCPPADAHLAELAKRDDVVALSLHVDYWDYLGWKDTFGRAQHTERQYAYAKVRGDGKVYTPQMVVNGHEGLVGSDREAVEEVLARSDLPLDVSISRNGGALDIVVQPGEAAPAYHLPEVTVRLIVFEPAASVTIERGENAGRTATYRNVVRSIRPIGMWKGERLEISLPADEMLLHEDYGCAVLVQEDRRDGPGRILGAARL